MSESETSSPRPAAPGAPRPARRRRYLLIGLAVFAATVGLLYLEENWRGQRAWETFQSELKARGGVFDRSASFSPLPPAAQNAFDAPKMREWFAREGESSARQPASELTSRIGRLSDVPGLKQPPRVLAEVWIAQPGEGTSGAVVLQPDNPAAREQAGEIVRKMVGRCGFSCRSSLVYLESLSQTAPARIFLQSPRVPVKKTVEDLFATPPGWAWADRLAVREVSSNRFQVVLDASEKAADFIAQTEPLEAAFQPIRDALQRPLAVLNANYDTVFGPDSLEPNFVALRVVSQVLADRAECRLLLRQPEKALGDLTLLYEARRFAAADPAAGPLTLVQAMINVAITGLYTSSVAEGLRLQAWDEPQLAVLQSQLAAVHLLPSLAASIADERGAVCRLFLRVPRGDVFNGNQSKRRPAPFWKTLPYDLVPQGWLDQNMVFYSALMQQQIDSLDSANQTVLPRKWDAGAAKVKAALTKWSPYKYLANMALPNFTKAFLTTSRNQTSASQAAIACALERFRLARGEYPETLEALSPRFMQTIPRDIIGGQPPRYRRLPGGKFLLYSTGWSGQDHGGHPAPDNKQGDWVWTTSR